MHFSYVGHFQAIFSPEDDAIVTVSLEHIYTYYSVIAVSIPIARDTIFY